MIRDFLPGACSLLFPVGCAACNQSLTGPAEALCPACLVRLPLLPTRSCRSCALPLPGPGAGVEVCLACRVRPPVFDRAVSPFLYEESAKALVTTLKYAGRMSLASFLGKRMACTIRERLQLAEAPPSGGTFQDENLAEAPPSGGTFPDENLEEAAPGASAHRLLEFPLQAVIPVPLHPVRLRERTFNQSALLGRVVAEELRISFRENGVVRRRFTRPQTELPREERIRNLRGAFAPGEDLQPPCVAVLLVDDVLTTGATAGACARLLKESGIRRVVVVTACRG